MKANQLNRQIIIPTIDVNLHRSMNFLRYFSPTNKRRQGGVLVHIALILYSFAAIEIVCDDYFASALEKISYNLNLTPVRIEKSQEK